MFVKILGILLLLLMLFYSYYMYLTISKPNETQFDIPLLYLSF